MFTRRRQHKVPKVQRRDGLALLIAGADVTLAAKGKVRIGLSNDPPVVPQVLDSLNLGVIRGDRFQ
jgi:hypothetical protein